MPRPHSTHARSSRRVGLFVVALIVCIGTSSWTLAVKTELYTSRREACVEGLRFVQAALARGAGAEMQRLFPEGFFFSHVMYGLASTQLAQTGDVEVEQALLHAHWALAELRSSAGKAVFDPRLKPAHGVFYAGWTLLLEAEIAALSPSTPPAERARVAALAEQLATAFSAQLDAGGSPFLQAYPGQSWPVDTVVALAALRRADAATGTDHGPLITRWRLQAAQRVDPKTGLLPHHADAATGAPLEGARGTSQTLIQRFWPLLDPDGAPQAYRRYRDLFVRERVGFVGVQEFPEGMNGKGDVDSGPLLFGFTLSGSAVAIGTARAHGDTKLADAIQEELDLLGLPLRWRGERAYLLGQLPVGDAFAAWSASTPLAFRTDHALPCAWWPLLWLSPWLVLIAGACWRYRRARSTTDA